ncbi:putative brevis radix (BRX) domain-containing protein [Helianthus debilis subsp. tardiflorus]
MAERLPVGAAKNIKSPSLHSSITKSSGDILSNVGVERSHGQMMPYEETDSSGSNNPLKPNTINNRSSAQNSSRGNTGEFVDEWVKQDEPGVYMTLTSLPGGAKDLKRVRFR